MRTVYYQVFVGLLIAGLAVIGSGAVVAEEKGREREELKTIREELHQLRRELGEQRKMIRRIHQLLDPELQEPEVEPKSVDAEETQNAMGWYFREYDLAGTRYYPQASAPVRGDLTLSELRVHDGHMARTGDLTGDGALELVVGHENGLRMYDHTGGLLREISAKKGDFILGDVSGNQELDIVLGRQSRGAAYTAVAFDIDGNRLGTFSRSGGARDNSLSPALLADLNGNGRKELVAVAGSGYGLGFRGVVVFDAQNQEELGAYEQGPSARFRGREISVGDSNADGVMEIFHGGFGPSNGKRANGTRDNQSWVFSHNSDAGIRWQRRFEGSGFVDSTALLYDVFGSQKPVVVAASTSHGWRTWDGRLGRAYLLDPKTGETLENYEHNFGKPVEVAAVADLNDDGRADILLSKRNGSKRTGSLLLLDAAENLPVRHRFDVSGHPVRVGAVVDINGNGSLEVIVRAGANVYVLNNSLKEIAVYNAGNTIRDVIVSDVTADGYNEIIVCDAADKVRVLGIDEGADPATVDAESEEQHEEVSHVIEDNQWADASVFDDFSSDTARNYAADMSRGGSTAAIEMSDNAELKTTLTIGRQHTRALTRRKENYLIPVGEDFDFEVDVMARTPFNDSLVNGITLWNDAARTKYLEVLSSSWSNVKVVQTHSGAKSEVDYRPRHGQWHSARVRREGSIYKCWVDDELIYEGEIPELEGYALRYGTLCNRSSHRTGSAVSYVDNWDFRMGTDMTQKSDAAKPGPSAEPPTSHTELLKAIGTKLVDAGGREFPSGVLADKDYVLLYFSAEWCPPCRTFTPKIVEFYEEYAEKANLEVVLVSSDRSEENMLSYMTDYEMNWPAVPYERRRESGLARRHGVRGIPRLLALDAEGKVVKDSARDGRGKMLAELGGIFDK